MDLWQYNAWSAAHQDRINDQLCIQVQAAYLGAYWGSAQKHKKSLQSVLREIQNHKMISKKRKAIDVEAVAKDFKQMEDLKTYGRYKC